jgi:DNA polymerase
MNSKLSILYKEACDCVSCGLCHSRTNTVFGSGSENARVLFVGEAPGEKEDLSGMPFVGRAGKLLDKYLCEAAIEREDVYITNILKCRPPKNRDPRPSEEDSCISFLERQIEIINPRVIVCLGRISAMRLINPKFKISVEHGVWFQRNNRDICAIYHPSFLLRDPRKHDVMLCDLLKIKEKMTSII